MSAATTPTDYVRAPRELVRKAHRLAQSAQTANDYMTGKIAMEIETPLAVLLAQPGELTSASTWSEIRERINPPPRPEWTSANTVNVNAKLKGWESFFEGRPRDDCPFPPARPDLKTAYQAGWDAAQSAPPRPGEIRVIDGKRCRFIERELEGEKWEVLGPADADPAPALEGGEVRAWMFRESPSERWHVTMDRRSVDEYLKAFSTAEVHPLAIATREGAPEEAGEVTDRMVTEALKERFTPERYARDYEYLEANFREATRQQLAAALRVQPPAIDIQRTATAAAEGVAKNAGIDPQLAFAPILWALEDALSGSKLKPSAEGRDVLGAGGPLGATAAVQVSDVVIRRMVEAHDAEEAAQKGEPSPWREDLGAVDDPAWVSERMTAMRCAVEAGRFTPAEAPSAYLFRVDGKWELSIVDPRERLSLKPEDVVQVPISAQPTATFVAKAKHLLDLAEEAEDKALEGDEGCVWPVEALRAAYADLPFVMTITWSGEGGET